MAGSECLARGWQISRTFLLPMSGNDPGLNMHGLMAWQLQYLWLVLTTNGLAARSVGSVVVAEDPPGSGHH